MNWRLYRLPGSRDKWHLDRGDGTAVINVRGYNGLQTSRSVDKGDGNPRAWIEFPYAGTDLHIINGIAVFTLEDVAIISERDCKTTKEN